MLLFWIALSPWRGCSGKVGQRVNNSQLMATLNANTAQTGFRTALTEIGEIRPAIGLDYILKGQFIPLASSGVIFDIQNL